MSSAFHQSREIESYEELIEEVENYGFDPDSSNMEEDEDFLYLTLEAEDSNLNDMIYLGDQLDAKTVAKKKGENRYTLSILK